MILFGLQHRYSLPLVECHHESVENACSSEKVDGQSPSLCERDLCLDLLVTYSEDDSMNIGGYRPADPRWSDLTFTSNLDCHASCHGSVEEANTRARI